MNYMLLITFVYAMSSPNGMSNDTPNVNNIVTTPVLNTNNTLYYYDECIALQEQFIEYSKTQISRVDVNKGKVTKITAECIQPENVNIWYDDANTGIPLTRNGDTYTPTKLKASSPRNNKYNLK